MAKTITKKQQLINDAIEVLDEYDMEITIRQLYYRLVVKKKLVNEKKEYKRLILALSDARVKSRQIPFRAFKDEEREWEGNYNRAESDHNYLFESAMDRFESAEDTFKKTADRYSLPAWFGQDNYVEVWCEKKALSSILSPICYSNSVVYGAAKGQPSITWLYEASKRIRRVLENDNVENVTILVYVDFDPAGLRILKTMKRHINETFKLPQVEFRKMALTQDHIERYSLVPDPVKPKDSQYKQWVAKYGAVSTVELDAIEPRELKRIVREDVLSFWDTDAAKRREDLIQERRDEIQEQIDEYFEDSNGQSEE